MLRIMKKDVCEQKIYFKLLQKKVMGFKKNKIKMDKKFKNKNRYGVQILKILVIEIYSKNFHFFKIEF